jgi:hypothetical protein
MTVLAAWLPAAQQVRGQGAPHNAGYLYLSPVPNASYVSAQTRYILVRFEAVVPSQVTNLMTDFISVIGNSSGPHQGTTRVATDARTVIFEMGTDFSPNELVTVTLLPQTGPDAAGGVGLYQYQFRITALMPGSLPIAVHSKGALAQAANTPDDLKVLRPTVAKGADTGITKKAVTMSNGVSVPSDFPQVVITVNTNPSPGYLFLENALDGVSPYTMMLDYQGLPVWYHQGRLFDFTIQKNRQITWGTFDNGRLDSGYSSTFYAFDQNFNFVRSYTTTNGYVTDGHDLKVQADGTYLMIGLRTNAVDLSQYYVGGDPNAVVEETVIQEFTSAGELIFQWRAWDNYDIGDLVPKGNTEFAHMNGIDFDVDGNILVSCRHLSEVTKINHDSGEIIWRLSGAHNGFTFINDPFNGTSYQHNISALGNNHYMVFDNGDYHTLEVSRAAEYQLDLTNMTATLVWQFRDKPDKYTYYLGSAQRLPTGNTLINFVQAKYPKAIEVDSDGVKHFELSLVPGSDAYRAFRLPWNGVVAAPYLIVEPQTNNITLIFNKFGDSNIAYYRIYGGPVPHPTTLLAESDTTLKQLSNLANGLYYFRVTAVSNDGIESTFSNEESTTVNIIPPGQNMVQNGDFSQGSMPWVTTVNGGASAALKVENGVGHFYITNSGSALNSIQLQQGGQVLIKGNRYVLEFDAWSSQTTYINVTLVRSTAPFTYDTQISPPFLTPNHSHYRYVFTMQQTSDYSASLLFNLGTATADIYLDNISLFNPSVGDLNQDGRVDFLDLAVFCSNWLKQQTGSPADLNGDSEVDFNDFCIFGQNWPPASR